MEIIIKAYIRCKRSYQNSLNNINDYITFLRVVSVIHEHNDFSYGKQITVKCLCEDLAKKLNHNKYLEFLEQYKNFLTNNYINYL